MSGRAVSRQYRVDCPTCGAKPREACRTLTTGRVTDTHLSRIDAAYPSPAAPDPRGQETESETP